MTDEVSEGYMGGDEVYYFSRKLSLPSEAELDALERKLAAPLPHGYRQYMTTFGEGAFCGYLNVLPPDQVSPMREDIVAYLDEWYAETWGQDGQLPLADLKKGLLFARSIDGDEVYWLKEKQGRLCVLPRHSDELLWMPQGFATPLDWRSEQGAASYLEAVGRDFQYFEPVQDRRIIGLFTAQAQQMPEVAEWLVKACSGEPIHRVTDALYQKLFLSQIGGVIQLTQAPEDVRVGVRIAYDSDFQARVDSLVQGLIQQGFYETWRFPSA